MPNNNPVVRVAPLHALVAEISQSPRPFVVINRARRAEGDFTLPDALFQYLPDDFSGDLLVAPTTLLELNNMGLPLGRRREQFMAGEPVLITVHKVHETPELAKGGQEVVGLEERARDGLYVTVVIVTERLRACADHRERRKMATDTRRFEIFEQLGPHLPPRLSAKNLFDAGQRLVSKWYPGPTAYQTMKSFYAGTLDLLGPGADPYALEAKQIELVRTASAVYVKTEAFVKSQHEMSNMLRELMATNEFKNATPAQQHDMQARLLREQAPSLHQEMAHDRQGGPLLSQLMHAAALMDFNPSSVFANVGVYKSEFECAMLLGRAKRGLDAMLRSDHIIRLERFLARAEEPESDVSADPEVQAARQLRDLALRIKTTAGWQVFFADAEREGGSSSLSKDL